MRLIRVNTGESCDSVSPAGLGHTWNMRFTQISGEGLTEEKENRIWKISLIVKDLLRQEHTISVREYQKYRRWKGATGRSLALFLVCYELFIWSKYQCSATQP